MKGVVLAGGKGTRLYPLTQTTNKHLLQVGKEPMVFHPIRQLISAGIEDILIITSMEYVDEMKCLLKAERNWRCHFTFKVQGEAKGIAHGLLLAEKFACNDAITVVLGDNIASHTIRPYVEKFHQQEKGAKVLLKKVTQPERFGVAILNNNKIVGIEEKPTHTLSPYAVTGIYMYDKNVFDIIRETQPSPRGEWEISEVNNLYIHRQELTYDLLEGEWVDAGTFTSYQYANQLLFRINNEIISGER
ncbi:MAG: sugar phosphate nucleotidyltransferase [Bacillota bacterium]